MLCWLRRAAKCISSRFSFFNHLAFIRSGSVGPRFQTSQTNITYQRCNYPAPVSRFSDFYNRSKRPKNASDQVKRRAKPFFFILILIRFKFECDAFIVIFFFSPLRFDRGAEWMSPSQTSIGLCGAFYTANGHGTSIGNRHYVLYATHILLWFDIWFSRVCVCVWLLSMLFLRVSAYAITFRFIVFSFRHPTASPAIHRDFLMAYKDRHSK